MYCTLQEAYNIPSFVSKKKKGCMNPLSATSKTDQSQSDPIAKISADSYDPYDSYTASNGREHALSYNNQQNQSDQNIQSEIPKKVTNENSGLSNKNSPICGASQGMVYNRQPENFTQQNSVNSYTNDIPYSAQANDYKYYCDKCKYGTNFKHSLVNHYETELHKTGQRKKKSIKEKEVYQCLECDYKSTNKNNNKFLY